MPSAIIHRAVAKNVLKKLEIYQNPQESYLYEVGAIAPDSWRNTKRFKDSSLPKIEKRLLSHFSKPGSFLEYYDDFHNKYKNYLDNPFMVGYLVHLMTDNIAHQDQIYKKIFSNKTENPTISKKKAKAINYLLYQNYDIEVLNPLSEEEIISLPIIEELEYDGINSTITYTNSELNSSISEALAFDGMDLFLELVEHWTNKIIAELQRYKIINQNNNPPSLL